MKIKWNAFPTMHEETGQNTTYTTIFANGCIDGAPAEGWYVRIPKPADECSIEEIAAAYSEVFASMLTAPAEQAK